MTPFSIALGGPLYAVYRRCHLVRASTALTTRRIAAFIAVTWLPLVVLSAVNGLALTSVEVPLASHIGLHVQFLLSLPLLLIADGVVHKWLPVAVAEFVERDLVAPADRPRFDSAIASSLRMRAATSAEVLVLAVSALAGLWLWEPYIAIHTST